MYFVRTKLEQWDEKLGADKVICFPMKTSLGSKEYCWLANLVNKFHFHGGFDMITDIITLPKTNLAVCLISYLRLTWFFISIDLCAVCIVRLWPH